MTGPGMVGFDQQRDNLLHLDTAGQQRDNLLYLVHRYMS